MRYAFFPGCVSRGGCPELYPAAKLICQRLGIGLQEMPSASCTGAGVLQEKNELLGDTLNARTFAMAEALRLAILTICSTCQGVMAQANHRMKESPEYLEKINAHLAVEGLEYRGTTEVKHLLWVLIEDYGLEELTNAVTRPLRGIRLAPFYGCYIIRPTDALDIDEHPERQTSLERLIEILGATVVDFAGKTRCCGFPILTINEKNSMAMVAKHTSEVKDLGADAMVTPCPLLPSEPGWLPAQGRGTGGSKNRHAYPALAPGHWTGNGDKPKGVGTSKPHHEHQAADRQVGASPVIQ